MIEALPLPEPVRINEEFNDEISVFQFYKTETKPENYIITITNNISKIMENKYNNVFENSNNIKLQPDGTFLVKKNKTLLYDINLTLTTNKSCRISVSLVDKNDSIYMIDGEPVMYTFIKSSKSESKNMILKSLINNKSGDVVKIMINSYTNEENPDNIITISSANIIIT